MPRQKITAEDILQAAYLLVREEGAEKLNARSLANALHCSVQPIYSCFGSMDALLERLYTYAYAYYDRYVEEKSDKTQYFQSIGKCHVAFASEEKQLFRFLFLSPYLHAVNFRDVYLKLSRSDVTISIQATLGLTPPQAEVLYLNMMVYTHGIACLIAADAADITAEEAHLEASFAYAAFLSKLREEL